MVTPLARTNIKSCWYRVWVRLIWPEGATGAESLGANDDFCFIVIISSCICAFAVFTTLL